MKIKVTKDYYDLEFRRIVRVNEVFEVTKDRSKVLISRGFVEKWQAPKKAKEETNGTAD